MRPAKTSLSRQRFQCCNKQFSQRQSSKNKICRDIFVATHSSVSIVKANKTLLRQQIIATVRNSVVTKVENNHKIMSQHSKECCNKVEELEEETSVVTKENYVVTKDE